MQVIVLMKPVHDPRLGLTEAEVMGMEFGDRESHMVFGPYDENALETALQIKDDHPDIQVTVMTMSLDVPQDLLRSTLAVGADQVVHIKTSPWAMAPSTVGQVVAEAINALDDVVMVLAGIQSGDWDTGFVPRAVAASLGLGFLANVCQIERVEDRWELIVHGSDGIKKYHTMNRFVASIASSGANTIRYPKMRDRLMAGRKPIRVEERPSQHLLQTELEWMPKPSRSVQWIDGPTDREKGRLLMRQIRDWGWLEGVDQ